ncbi:MAG: type II toxin-antitoxin system RelE/ParE family toxin [Methanomassiliicoccales archaeon]|nr:MAG: type II toxin-antitoxin system RelE/ParE family toxin [Methanomassiliicoccales archaeon]
MPARIEYKASVERDLRRIDKKDVNRILKQIEKVLGENPDKGVLLKGEYRGLYKLRVGDYRVIYCRTKEGVLILRIRHRGKAY